MTSIGLLLTLPPASRTARRTDSTAPWPTISANGPLISVSTPMRIVFSSAISGPGNAASTASAAAVFLIMFPPASLFDGAPGLANLLERSADCWLLLFRSVTGVAERRPSSIDRQRHSGHEAGCVGGEKQDR